MCGGIVVCLPLTFFLFTVSVAVAQQPAKVPRIGYLSGGSLLSGNAEAFRQGLRELGYVEGKNIVIEWRFGDAKPALRSEHSAELARLKVDVIVAASATDTRAAKDATATIPIVMGQGDDPVQLGFVASLARPGGNITGLATLSPEISGKRLELLNEIIPRFSRVAVFGTSKSASNAQELREVELAAGALGLKLQYFDVLAFKEIETVFRAAAKQGSDAVFMNVSGSIIRATQRKKIADLAVKNRLPVTYHRRSFVEDGGLMSYGVDYLDLHRRAATYVDKILKGAKPAGLPVEQPTKFELVINLTATKQIGVTIPPNLLARADRVIR
jgi:putative ABC transport system substrate-binding protein